jgi:hypothetical protein
MMELLMIYTHFLYLQQQMWKDRPFAAFGRSTRYSKSLTLLSSLLVLHAIIALLIATTSRGAFVLCSSLLLQVVLPRT